MKQITCPHCQNVFIPTPVIVDRNCPECSVAFKSSGRRVYCSNTCQRKNEGRRKRKTEGHRRRVKAAYIRRKADPKFVEKYRLAARLYWAKAKSDNPIYVIKNYLRSRIRRLVKESRPSMSALIGCSGKELKVHIENQFTKGMTWGNYGRVWVIDHIHPLSSFNLEDRKQITLACHFTNLRPLTISENQEKGAKITVPQMRLTM